MDEILKKALQVDIQNLMDKYNDPALDVLLNAISGAYYTGDEVLLAKLNQDIIRNVLLPLLAQRKEQFQALSN